MTAALGRMEEFALHASATAADRASPTTSSTSCCSRSPRTAGAPAGVSARRALPAVRADAGPGMTVGVTSSGFVGLGNMGERAGGQPRRRRSSTSSPTTSPAPTAAPTVPRSSPDLAEVARRAEVVVLSLPDGAVSERWPGRSSPRHGPGTTHVIDTSTVGVARGPGDRRTARRRGRRLRRRAGVRRRGRGAGRAR